MASTCASSASAPSRCPWLGGESRIWRAWTWSVLLATALAFVVPALHRTGGQWPAPLDDVYIYFGFARSWALGAPMSWIPGNGYSSGCTSPLYPLLLAPAYALGLRGTALGWFATALGIVSLYDLCRSMRKIVGRGASSFAAPLLVVAIPLLDWSWLSGMETALLGALLGRTLAAAHGAMQSPPHRRTRHQWALGAWSALVLLTRPEAVAFVAPVGLAAVYLARSASTAGSLLRALGPAAATVAAQGLLNRSLTGEWAPAGAVRKLLTSSPFVDAHQIALEYLKNLMVLVHQAFERSLGPVPLGLAVPLLAAAALISRRYRPLALPLWLGTAGTLTLICLNSTARFQNYRYAAPCLALLVMAACLGTDAVARGTAHLRRRRWGRRAASAVAALAVAAALLAPADQLSHQIDHFARASANIVHQQGEMARRLAARRPLPRRVMVNDAGAIPYLSGLPAIDGLGLGGFRGLPFARASVHGSSAVVELIERLAPADRPDLLAVYPSWWPGLVARFGRRLDAVRITDNVICAADEKVLYRADWSALARPGEAREGQLDELDVGDLVDERAHRYELPSPTGGRLVDQMLALSPGQDDGQARYDAGRRIPEGASEQFVVREGLPDGAATLVLRAEPTQRAALRIEVRRGPRRIAHHRLAVEPEAPSRWRALEISLVRVRSGDRIRTTVVQGSWHSYHYWLLRR